MNNHVSQENTKIGCAVLDRKSDKSHVSKRASDAAECFTRHLRAHTCTQHTTRTMAGLLNMAGLSLTGAFAGAQLRAPAPAARVSHTGFSVVAVRAFRRSQLFPSRDRRIASAHARRARGGTPSDRRERARGGARVRRRCSASRRVPRDGARAPEDPARRAHRPRASPFRVRVWVHSALARCGG